MKNAIRDKKQIPRNLTQYIEAASLPILNLNIVEQSNRMGEKAFAVLKESFEKYEKLVDWFFMVDDDAYVFVKNLFQFIKSKNTLEPKIYGFRFLHETAVAPDGHVAGGPGINKNNL